MFKPRVHYHSRNPSEELYGERLEPSDPIDAGVDRYEDQSGQWLPCKGLHGQKAGQLIVVRPLPVWSPPLTQVV